MIMVDQIMRRRQEEEDNDFQNEKIVAWTETIEYVKRPDNTLHPHHPDLYPGPLEVYTKFQLDLYSLIYGLNAINAKDIQEFKDRLQTFQKIRKLKILKCYLFAKRHNISRNGGDEFLKLMRFMSPDSIADNLPTSWKTITRTIDDDTKFYICHKKNDSFSRSLADGQME